ncbi:Qat anti-phage system associated protein QatB [Pseudomonas aeruginosa]|uniref:Qat anti-phage system associated protein QatB n=1 Tax=Pseudomonas aeruginosa TaxID=287 RepID=UPI00295F5AC9|nr:Qat anti-phage system associated protein QatB [Pseudomonas aeruginosa]
MLGDPDPGGDVHHREAALDHLLHRLGPELIRVLLAVAHKHLGHCHELWRPDVYERLVGPSGARNSFTRFAGSGGSDRASLGRAVSRYVSTSAGGSRQAAQRMGASRGAGARLLGFLADAQARGVREALRALDLESLAGRPITEIFVGLADYVCPGAGTVDEGIAREAYIETIVELASEGLTDLTTFTPDQMQTVFELYATHAIEARICNDIGTKAVTMPTDAQAAHRVEQQLRDFIRGGVSDALTRARAETPNLTPERIQGFVDAVYESAFAILQTLGDAEANQ